MSSVVIRIFVLLNNRMSSPSDRFKAVMMQRFEQDGNEDLRKTARSIDVAFVFGKKPG